MCWVALGQHHGRSPVSPTLLQQSLSVHGCFVLERLDGILHSVFSTKLPLNCSARLGSSHSI
ncbi:hypothetical protein BU16DRAFT_606115 [Lophium mytilinum]|uniref:Uncharacterized protein n=1 Tax=Lophium mytilinum TaxID=390894 RepID=A0A6A6R0W3_9PEZI|nr:hypothetical protein BU16DRAFT_606115 [Lophium mytilinum]